VAKKSSQGFCLVVNSLVVDSLRTGAGRDEPLRATINTINSPTYFFEGLLESCKHDGDFRRCSDVKW